MQFHLDGFLTGDPTVADPDAPAADPARALPADVDVLIVGCGPAGLTLAAQLAAFPTIRTAIVERKAGPLTLGQADGIACRTMEMFEAFGFAERVLKEAYWVNETSFWKPDEQRPDHIVRGGRVQDTESGLSEFPHVILNQARVHDFYLDAMRSAPARIEPYYGRALTRLAIDPGNGAQAWFAREDGGDAVEPVRARYVVGCDGARSTVRSEMGLALRGDAAGQAWGVMDVLAITDFPDIRLKAAIHSAEEGSVLIIPREGGYLVRFYIELDALRPGERIADRGVTVDRLIDTARRVLHPYTLDVKEVAWWSIYEIGQRLCDRYDDGDPAAAVAGAVAGAGAAARGYDPGVFIAGDACHTHSPKAGQGMNVSMQDGFNLGWKLASVLLGRATPALLGTYTVERHAIARELIDFDRDFAKMFGAAPKAGGDMDDDSVDPAAFQDYFVQKGRFTAGTATHYAPSIVTAEAAHRHLARGFVVGMRFHSAPVVRVADAKPVELSHVVKADGRWRLFLFAGAGDNGGARTPVGRLCAHLASDPASPLRRFTPAGYDIDAILDVRAIFQASHRALALEAMPPLLRPAKGRYGLRDHEKIFAADPEGASIYAARQIDTKQGCIVVVRPDQYVAHVLPLDAIGELGRFFDGFMVSGHVDAPERRA